LKTKLEESKELWSQLKLILLRDAAKSIYLGVSLFERVIGLYDYSCLIPVMGLAAFHLIFEEAEEKNNVHKGIHFTARPIFSTAFLVI
jgi:hypothetical protein